MNSLIIQSKENVRWGYVLGYFVLFLFVPPIVGLPLIINLVWKKANPKLSDYLLLMFCLAIYLGAINATKQVGYDQYNYYMAYMNVPTLGFVKSLIYIYGADYYVDAERTIISGEFMNGVYNYLGYYLTFGYYSLFAALYTFGEYLLIYLGLYKICRRMKMPKYPIVCGIIILSFFYLFFQYTLQIQKQFFAQSIMMYVLGLYAEKGKMSWKLWLIALCAIFTHASTALFLPFLVFKPLRGRLTKKWLLFIGFMLFLFILYGPRMAENVVESNSGVAGYGMKRFAESEGQADLASHLVMSQVLVIAVPMFIIVFTQLWLKRHVLIDKAQAFILNITLLLLLSVASMYTKPLAQIRYFMMLLAFMPFVYPFISSRTKTRNFWLMSIAVVMVVWFYVQFEFIIWHYAPEWQILVYPPVGLIAKGF
jgi:hypothetical protein